MVLLIIIIMVTVVASGLGFLVFLSLESKINKAKGLEEKGLYDNALQVFQEAITKNPSNYEAHWHIADIYYKKKHFDKALNEYEEALALIGSTLHPDEIVFHKILQKLYHRKFMFNESYLQLRIILLFEPENVEVLYLLGQFMAAGRNYQQAITHFKKILELVGEYKETRLFLALSELEYGARDEAISNLEKVLELTTENAFVHLILGYLYKDDNHERSMRNFELASEVGYEFFYEYNSKIMMSFFYMDRAEYEKAIEILEPVAGSTKDMDLQSASDVLFNLAWCYYKIEKRMKSVEYWEQLIKANFRYIDSYAVFKTYDPREIEALENKWRESFQSKEYPSVHAKLGSFQKLNLTLAEKSYEEWYQERASQLEENTDKLTPRTLKYIDELPEMSLGELQPLGPQVIERLGYSLKEEIPSTAGYDALIERREEKYKRLFQLRAWGRVVGEIAIMNLRANIDAVNATGGVLVTAADYTDGAVEAAAKYDIMLVDREGLGKALELQMGAMPDREGAA